MQGYGTRGHHGLLFLEASGLPLPQVRRSVRSGRTTCVDRGTDSIVKTSVEDATCEGQVVSVKRIDSAGRDLRLLDIVTRGGLNSSDEPRSDPNSRCTIHEGCGNAAPIANASTSDHIDWAAGQR